MGRLARLLSPRSIAVIGGRPAAELIRQARRIGYAGEIWPVHPNKDEIEGIRAFRSVADLPAAPDAAFVGINRAATVETIAALAARGAGGAVAYAAGFAEVGPDGAALQADLVGAAGDMPFLGPNCYGAINYLDGALLWPDQHGGRRVERGVALVTQSGNIGINLTMQMRGLPVGHVVTLGNQASVGVSEVLDAMLDDARVTAIGLHIEGLDDAAAFARAAARARAQRVPVVALAAGRSAAGAALAISHTASLSGSGAAMDAFLRAMGVVPVRSIPVLIETLKLLHVHGPLPGREISSMSCSGGEAALVADGAEGAGLVLRPLTEADRARVGATLPEIVAISNPLDYHTFIWGNVPALTETFAAMMAAGFDLNLLVLDFPRTDRCSDADWNASLEGLRAAVSRTGARAAIVATLAESMPDARAEALVAAGIVPFAGLDEALAATAAAAEAGALMARPAPDWTMAPAPAGRVRTFGEVQAKGRLARYGLVVPEGRLAGSEMEAVAAAKDLGFPVALKTVGGGIAHKTEMDAVRLNLGTSDAVAAAADILLQKGDGLLVERMVPDGVAELIVGIARDPVLGPHLVVGSGGILVELVGDSRILMMPASREEVADAIAGLKVAALLAGHRGRPAGDMDAALDAIMAIQDFARAHRESLVELDVNPLIVRPRGKGAVAVDALIRMAQERP
jgi:acyl-CoA synthetase (NDP forming)